VSHGRLRKLVDEDPFSQSLFESLDTLEAQLVDATARKERLTAEVATARSKSQALYTSEALIDAIRSGDPERRLKLKAEIAKRISRSMSTLKLCSTTLFITSGLKLDVFWTSLLINSGGDPGPAARPAFPFLDALRV
jgi:hypothetical protein